MTDVSPEAKDIMTPEELKDWLAQEIRDSAKAHELRTKEVTEFVAAYSAGNISAEEAVERFRRYDKRWGEALYGVSAFPGTSDDEIVRAIDAAREEMLSGGSHSSRLSRRNNPRSGSGTSR